MQWFQVVTGRDNIQGAASVMCRTRHEVDKTMDGENFSQLTCVGVGCLLEMNISVADDKNRVDECCERMFWQPKTRSCPLGAA